jgi:hypothetical protein
MTRNRDKIEGPLLYDSLDRPNPPAMNQSRKPEKQNTAHIALIIPAVIIPVFLIGYVLLWLHSISVGYGSSAALASFIIWTLNISVIVFLISVLLITLYGIITYIKRNELISLDDGIHVSAYNASGANYTAAFNRLIELQYNVLLERAKQSEFQGVTTLTLDRSTVTETSTTSVETGYSANEEDADLIDATKGKLAQMRDKGLIGRSNNSILIGFSSE